MTEIPVCFELPNHLTIETLISNLAKKCSLQLTAQYYAVKTFYDSFDWRLYNAGLLCEFTQAKNISQLNLINYSTGQRMVSADLEKLPTFVAELADPALTQQLLPLLEMRALLSVTSLNLQIYQLAIRNADQKIVAWLLIEEYELLKHRIILQPIKGGGKLTLRLTRFLTASLGLKTTANKSVLTAALKLQGRTPGDYSSKLTFKLEANLLAATAVKIIYQHLLQTMKLNEQGTINAIDSEFLHDFRVAVRRTRVGLSQFKMVSAGNVTRRYSEYFAWLGQITSPVRDLDVYLLNFEHYKTSLPPSMREDLQPLREFLTRKQAAAQVELAHQLKSRKYLTNLIDWEQYLKQEESAGANQARASLTVKQLSDLKIWKVYQQVIKQGTAINDKSPAATLHDLRKTCKKLRYLIEFFQDLYSAIEIKPLIKSLKELQELLGEFQDCAVQEQALKHFSEELKQSGCPEQTFLAIEKLAQILEDKCYKARRDFAGCFTVFAAPQNCAIVKSLVTRQL